MQVENGDAFSRSPARLFVSLPWERLPLRLRAALVLAAAALISFVGYLAATNYPDTSTPRGSEAERQIAAVFGLPRNADAVVTGDLLVERFYAVDVETGERYVADILKGRVQGVQERVGEDGATSYALLLDLRNLQRDRALLAAFVDQVARPSGDGAGYYLGLSVPSGLNDAFLLNYDGSLPTEHADFRGPAGEDVYGYLVGQKFADVSGAPQILGVEGFNYLLSNTEQFSYFRGEFRVNKALFISELVLVDLTSRPQAGLFYRLLGQYPRSQSR